MKKRLQGLVAGVLIGSIIASGAVFAKQASEWAELYYNNIKIYIDGGEITPKDANGNNVEPFTMNGTTYLPVRAISNAFGKDVEWDGSTQSVYIGKKDQTKPDNYLSKLQYNNYKEGNDGSKFEMINGTITDYNKTIYKNGILFYVYYGSNNAIQDDTDKASSIISYPLNSQYKTLKGKIVLPKECNLTTLNVENIGTSSADVYFYGDGKLLYKATSVTSSMPFNVNINVSGVNQLDIKLKTDNGSWGQTYVALTDLALYK